MVLLRKIALLFIVAVIPLSGLFSQQEGIPVFKQVTHLFHRENIYWEFYDDKTAIFETSTYFNVTKNDYADNEKIKK